MSTTSPENDELRPRYSFEPVHQCVPAQGDPCIRSDKTQVPGDTHLMYKASSEMRPKITSQRLCHSPQILSTPWIPNKTCPSCLSPPLGTLLSPNFSNNLRHHHWDLQTTEAIHRPSHQRLRSPYLAITVQRDIHPLVIAMIHMQILNQSLSLLQLREAGTVI